MECSIQHRPQVPSSSVKAHTSNSGELNSSLAKHQPMTLFRLRQQSPTAHLESLRNPRLHAELRLLDVGCRGTRLYLSPDLANTSDAYLRLIDRQLHTLLWQTRQCPKSKNFKGSWLRAEDTRQVLIKALPTHLIHWFNVYSTRRAKRAESAKMDFVKRQEKFRKELMNEVQTDGRLLWGRFALTRALQKLTSLLQEKKVHTSIEAPRAAQGETARKRQKHEDSSSASDKDSSFDNVGIFDAPPSHASTPATTPSTTPHTSPFFSPWLKAEGSNSYTSKRHSDANCEDNHDPDSRPTKEELSELFTTCALRVLSRRSKEEISGISSSSSLRPEDVAYRRKKLVSRKDGAIVFLLLQMSAHNVFRCPKRDWTFESAERDASGRAIFAVVFAGPIQQTLHDKMDVYQTVVDWASGKHEKHGGEATGQPWGIMGKNAKRKAIRWVPPFEKFQSDAKGESRNREHLLEDSLIERLGEKVVLQLKREKSRWMMDD